MPRSPQGLALKYLVDDVPGATTPGTQLYSILEAFEAQKPIGPVPLAFLVRRGYLALHDLIAGATSLEGFRETALGERVAREAAAPGLAAASAATHRARKAELAARAQAYFDRRNNDPVARRRDQARTLRARYGLGFIDSDHYPRVMEILRQVDGEQPPSPEDMAWLATEARDCWTPALRTVVQRLRGGVPEQSLSIAEHRLEAKALTDEWERTRNPWAAVAASSHWRKAEAADEALKVTEAALGAPELAAKVRSALCTTRGGALRDLGRRAEARKIADEAHHLAPADFRPCTLLGAIHIELGDFPAGQKWYRAAEELGAKSQDVDRDLRAILNRAAPETRERLRAHLHCWNPRRFAWARDQQDRPG